MKRAALNQQSSQSTCSACRRNSLVVESDGQVWDMGASLFSLPVNAQPWDTRGNRLLLCFCCAEGLRLLELPVGPEPWNATPIVLTDSAMFDLRLLRLAYRDWMDERLADWTPEGSLDRALVEFYEAARRRQFSVVGDSDARRARRRYLRARRKRIRRETYKMHAFAAELIADNPRLRVSLL